MSLFLKILQFFSPSDPDGIKPPSPDDLFIWVLTPKKQLDGEVEISSKITEERVIKFAADLDYTINRKDTPGSRTV